MSMKNFNDTIRNQICDLLACSAEPQPTTSLRATQHWVTGQNVQSIWHFDLRSWEHHTLSNHWAAIVYLVRCQTHRNGKLVKEFGSDKWEHCTGMWWQRVALTRSKKIFLSYEGQRCGQMKIGCDRFQSHCNGYWGVRTSPYLRGAHIQ
jgi:hypothetical protein